MRQSRHDINSSHIMAYAATSSYFVPILTVADNLGFRLNYIGFFVHN